VAIKRLTAFYLLARFCPSGKTVASRLRRANAGNIKNIFSHIKPKIVSKSMYSDSREAMGLPQANSSEREL